MNALSHRGRGEEEEKDKEELAKRGGRRNWQNRGGEEGKYGITTGKVNFHLLHKILLTRTKPSRIRTVVWTIYYY